MDDPKYAPEADGPETTLASPVTTVATQPLKRPLVWFWEVMGP